MTTEAPVRCRCGKVRGVATEISPRTSSRVVCYCDDCQAFARFLGADDVLDALGGTDICQMAAPRLRITEGRSELRCVRLSPKGLHRWYADCCKTPVANTINGRIPFVGIVQPFMNYAGDGRSRDEALGKPVAYVHGKFAIGGLPPHAHPTAPPRFILGAIRRFVGWFLSSRGKASPFFDRKTRAPIATPRVLTPAERDALRARR
jgi:hypothetical protein